MADGELLYEIVARPSLDDPVLVVGLEGWIDAGYAAATAGAHLLAILEPTTIVQFDVDVLVDHRSRRPLMHLVEGVNTGLSWPKLELRHGKDGTGRDVLLLVGMEPDIRWRAFSEQVVDLIRALGVRLVVGLGAYPAALPHTRPGRLAATATTAELAARAAPVRATLDVPAGVQAAIERRCAEVGLDAVGLWAQVPHYLVGMAYPPASALLVEGLGSLADRTLDTAALHDASVTLRQRVDELVAGNEEHQEMVRALEAGYDADEASAATEAQRGPLPSGEQLAAEFQRFLREQDEPG